MSSIHHICAWYRHHLEMTLQLLPSIQMKKKNQKQNVITYSCTSIRSFDDNVDKFNKVNNVSHGKPQILSNIIFNRYWAIANESTTIASTIDVFSKLLINILRILDGFREFNVNISALLCYSAINLNVIVSSITKSYGFIQFKSTSKTLELPFNIPVFLNADWFSVNLSLITVYFRNIQRMWFEI